MNVSDYKQSNANALKLLLLPTGILILALWLSFSQEILLYFIGQLFLSFFFLQTFLLLHECGHLSFFKTRILNKVVGNIFGFLTMIPYFSWQQVHGLHHRWAGWRDKDPTTTPTAYPSTSKAKNFLVNVAWRIWLPLFYLAYKIGNYWNLGKIKKYVAENKYKKVRNSVLVYAAAYLVLAILLGGYLVKFALPAFLLSLIWKEVIIMSQHSHVDMPLAEGRKVKPFAFLDQVQYTRSFYLPAWISKYFLFNVNLHEAHHAYPGIPAYELGRVDLNTAAEPKFFAWLIQAKKMKGEDYVFRTSKHTGKKF